ncbi:MAG: protein translocase subunit SecF [Alphaproteobacteria bacterium]
MKFLSNANFNFMKRVKLFVIASLVFIVSSLALIGVKGINYGIDFSGGLLIEVKVKQGVTISDLRSKISKLDNIDSSLQEFGNPDDILIRSSVDNMDLNDGIKLIKETINYDVIEFRRVELVGPVVGDELKQDAMWAVFYSLLAMMLYIWFRFEWQYSLAALVALFHDVLITMGVVALFNIEFGLPVLAAILTIAGYSINDTVVIFDRVRENFIKHTNKEYKEIFNMSINQSLNRTIMTSVTTLIALMALYIFGGEVIAGFTFAMIIGVVIGTYSSNFLAIPILLAFKPNRGTTDEFVDPIKAKFKLEQNQEND